MTDLTNITETLMEFGENHKMINGVHLIRDVQEIQHLTFVYRSFCIHLTGARIPRSEGDSVYELDFNLFIIDKVAEGTREFLDSNQENLFILGQLQDYLQQDFFEYDFSMADIDLSPVSSDEYNLTGATATLTVRTSRDGYSNIIND